MMHNVEALLLAAGESTRMGRLKALLPWTGGQPLLRYQIDQLMQSPVDRIVVVLGHRRDELRTLLPADARVVAVENPQYGTGKVSSIIAGVSAIPAGRHVLILAVDQPRPAWLIQRVLAAHLEHGAPITVAGHDGRRGHPVIFAPSLRDELLRLEEATQGLRAVLARHASAVQVIETDTPLALLNLNTPDDYEAARRLAGLE
jgi:molybdenum cofactor cytidylyltransferase